MCLTYYGQQAHHISSRSPVVGYRAFRVGTHNKRTVAFRLLHPMFVIGRTTWFPQGTGVHQTDQSPSPQGDHGLYMFKTLQSARSYHMFPPVLGKVEMWGSCVEHTDGWRGTFARIKWLYVLGAADVEGRCLELHANYGVPVWPFVGGRLPRDVSQIASIFTPIGSLTQ